MTVQTPTPQPVPQPVEQPRTGIAGALTRKLGPLPVWAWAVVIGGAGLVWRMTRSGGQQTVVQEVPTTAIPGDQSATTAGFLNELTVALKRIEDNLGKAAEEIKTKIPTPAPKPPAGSSPKPPAGWDLGTYILGIRSLNPTLYQQWLKQPNSKQTAGETREQRTARLIREIQFYISKGIKVPDFVLAMLRGGQGGTILSESVEVGVPDTTQPQVEVMPIAMRTGALSMPTVSAKRIS